MNIKYLLIRPWVFRLPPHWPGWRRGRGGCWWTQRDWTGPTARGRDSSLSWHWSLWRDHPFDWQPDDCSQSSCNRTGLPEREVLHGSEPGRGQTDGRKEGGSERNIIKERRHGWEDQAGKQIKKRGKKRLGNKKEYKKRRQLKKWVICLPKPLQRETQLGFFMTLCVDTLDKLTSTKMLWETKSKIHSPLEKAWELDFCFL